MTFSPAPTNQILKDLCLIGSKRGKEKLGSPDSTLADSPLVERFGGSRSAESAH